MSAYNKFTDDELEDRLAWNEAQIRDTVARRSAHNYTWLVDLYLDDNKDVKKELARR